MDRSQDAAVDFYVLLGLSRHQCTPDDVKSAYRRLARRLHPDKGGSPEAFGVLSDAFETLSHPGRRAVYDAHRAAAAAAARGGAGPSWAAASAGTWRGAGGAPGESSVQVPGAEAALLQQLLRSRRGGGAAGPGCTTTAGGSAFDPMSQLVVVCELCSRPATEECWTCGMNLCTFCGRRRHYKGDKGLHWPLFDRPGRMAELLGRQEFERKRIEDGRQHLLDLPGQRSDAEERILREFLQIWRDWEAAASQTSAAPGAPLELLASPKCTTGRPGGAVAACSIRGVGGGCCVPNGGCSSGGVCFGSGPKVQRRLLGAHQGACCGKDDLDAALSRYYMWAQTNAFVHVAVYNPLAEAGVESLIDVTPAGLRVGAEDRDAAAAAPAGGDAGALTCTSGGGRGGQLGCGGGGGGGKGGACGKRWVVDREWRHPVDCGAGSMSWAGGDGGRLVLLKVAKARPGQEWHSVFKGDSLGSRCLVQPYSLSVSQSEASLDLPLPRWIVPSEDVEVNITSQGLEVEIVGLPGGKLLRTFWQPGGRVARFAPGAGGLDWARLQPERGGAGDDGNTWVQVEPCCWSVVGCGRGTEAAQPSTSPQQPPQERRGEGAAPAKAAVACNRSHAGGRVGCVRGGVSGADKVLTVTVAFEDLGGEETGPDGRRRSSGAAAERHCLSAPRGQSVLAGGGRQGWSLFEEDEDRYGFRPLLQASTFEECGCTWVAPNPWDDASPGGQGHHCRAFLSTAPAAFGTPRCPGGGGGSGGVIASLRPPQPQPVAAAVARVQGGGAPGDGLDLVVCLVGSGGSSGGSGGRGGSSRGAPDIGPPPRRAGGGADAASGGGMGGRWVKDEAGLPAAARAALISLRTARAADVGGTEGR